MGPLIGSGLSAPVRYLQTPTQESGLIKILLSTQPHPGLDPLLIHAEVALGSIAVTLAMRRSLPVYTQTPNMALHRNN